MLSKEHHKNQTKPSNHISVHDLMESLNYSGNVDLMSQIEIQP